VRADLYTLGGLSAHADRAALLSWLVNFRRPPRKTFVVHGEETVAMGFAADLRNELGWDAEAPEPGTSVILG
jgi:metallo-beta-lactamase family protein